MFEPLKFDCVCKVNVCINSNIELSVISIMRGACIRVRDLSRFLFGLSHCTTHGNDNTLMLRRHL